MSNFKEGDIVFCTKSNWVNDKKISFFNPPKAGQEVVVRSVMWYKGRQLLQLSNQPKNVYYPALHFKPRYTLFAQKVIDDLTLSHLL